MNREIVLDLLLEARKMYKKAYKAYHDNRDPDLTERLELARFRRTCIIEYLEDIIEILKDIDNE